MRIIYSDNGTLTDISKKIENYKNDSYQFSYVLGQDYFYLGSDLPFNHFYIKMVNTNSVSGLMTIEYWNGREWIEAVNIIDETACLLNSGFVEFTPNKKEKWVAESTNDSGEQITGLTSIKIYDLYWARVSFDVTMTANRQIAWIGNLFSNDSDLFAEYPIFNKAALLTAVEAGKTNWEEQHVIAAKLLIKDMVAKNIIKGGESILKREYFNLAAVSKTAQLIFNLLGDDYVDDMVSARQEYKERLENSTYPVDQNNDALLDTAEKFSKTGFMTR